MIGFDESRLLHTQTARHTVHYHRQLHTLMAQTGNGSGSYLGCGGLFLRLVKHAQVFGWSLTGFILPGKSRRPGVNYHLTGW